MKIEVVGTGCATCKQLYALTQRLAMRIGEGVEVEYISDDDGMKRLMELGMMRSPVLVVDGKVAMVGYDPSMDVIKEKILAVAN